MRVGRLRGRFLALFVGFFLDEVLADERAMGPLDFEPLTSVPWTRADSGMEGDLDAIFREPNLSIRYSVLAEYLRTIPVAELSKAFDLCTRLEGTQTPDVLVAFFLEIWAKRDPRKCWERTRTLFGLVIEHDWLSYDSWEKRPRIVVQDVSALRT
jgi:hypothetical protein